MKDRVMQSVIAAEVSKGHLKWKVSDLARQAKVSRPLIYYHFGKTKKEILSECMRLIAEDYFALNLDLPLLESLNRTRGMFLKNPSLAVFYQQARTKKSGLSDQLQDIEKRYQKKLAKSFPHLSAVQIKALHALFHGIITAPFIDDRGLEAAVGLIDFNGANSQK